MASTRIPLSADTWVEVGSSDGSIKQNSGNGKVVYLESAIAPVGFDENTPVMEDTVKGESWTAYSVDGSVYARAIGTTASITYSPVGA